VRIIGTAATWLLIWVLAATVAGEDVEVRIDGNRTYQVYEGFGATTTVLMDAHGDSLGPQLRAKVLGGGLQLGGELFTMARYGSALWARPRLPAGVRQVIQVYDPKRGPFGPGSEHALSSEARGVGRLFDPKGRVTWVSPHRASQMNWWRRLMSGRWKERAFVEFNVLPGELHRATGVKGFLGQHVVPGQVSLAGRSAVFGTLPVNYMGYVAVYGGVPAGMGLGTYGVYRGYGMLR